MVLSHLSGLIWTTRPLHPGSGFKYNLSSLQLPMASQRCLLDFGFCRLGQVACWLSSPCDRGSGSGAQSQGA